MAKAALLAGFGRDNLRLVETDPQTYAMRPDALAAAIEADLARGSRPAAVVATVGTTGTTAIDPVAEIAAVTGAHQVWLHVDAAMAGSALLLPEMRWLIDRNRRRRLTSLEPAQVAGHDPGLLACCT